MSSSQVLRQQAMGLSYNLEVCSTLGEVRFGTNDKNIEKFLSGYWTEIEQCPTDFTCAGDSWGGNIVNLVCAPQPDCSSIDCDMENDNPVCVTNI